MRSRTVWALAGAVLSCLVAPVPAHAEGPTTTEPPPDETSIWYVIQRYTTDFEQLVLASGYTNVLSQCGNGSPQFTAFIPMDEFVVSYLRKNKISIADISGQPGAAETFVADHIMNGHLIPVDLVSSNFSHMQMWSGRNLVKEKVANTGPAEVGVNVVVNGQFIIYYHHACNGVVYFLYGDTYGPPAANVAGRPAIEAANFAGAPQGAVRPQRPAFYEMTPEMSDLPDTK